MCTALSLVACVLCVPIGFAAVIFALLANVERAHMTSLQPAETENQESNSEEEDGSDSGGADGTSSGAEEKPGAGGERGSAQKAKNDETYTKSKRKREGEKRSDREKKSEGRRELPFDVHRRRMGRLNRYASLLAFAVLLIGTLTLFAGILFVIYYYVVRT